MVAAAGRAHLDRPVHYESAIALGCEVSAFDPDARLSPVPETDASKSGRAWVIALAEREGFTVRQLAQRLGCLAGWPWWGRRATSRTRCRNGWRLKGLTASM
ncbi:hypothetical protein [Achromobacter marplatensis]|uniref:hypothetical protein n=1 Tax=Achromobacter marplatensis TaxID=470868 RepID=UPI0036F2FF6F